MGRQVLNVESHAGKRVAQRPLQEAVSKAENGRVASVLLPRFSAFWIFQPVTKLVVELIQFCQWVKWNLKLLFDKWTGHLVCYYLN